MGPTFPLVEVSGDAYSLGRQHGEQAAGMIHRYLGWIERLTDQPPGRLRDNALRFLPFIERLSPRYVEEVRGLADGAKIALADAMLCQARAEAAQTWDGGCTAFALRGAATARGQVLAGQNQDLDPESLDVALLLRVRPADGRPRALMLTFAGQLGYAGMNAHGLAHFTNALYGFPWRPGLPHYPLKRVMLEQRTVAEAIAVARAHRTCSAANMVFADGEGAIGDVEIRPDGIAEFDDDHPDRRLHANHCITTEFGGHDRCTLPDSYPRLDRMRELVQAAWGGITVDTLKRILADHLGDPGGICRHGAVRLHSICGYIAEPAERMFHVRWGHGCSGAWAAYEV